MNELTKQRQEIMVPKAALIAYEYQEGHYASGSGSFLLQAFIFL